MIKTPLSTVIGGAFWTPSCTILGGTSKTFNQLIKSLFANNEQGFAYDPNDLSTMWQDAAGTVPVTGVGQPVGLILDKSGRNNHAYQTTSAARPIFRQKPILGSELVVNGDFSTGISNWGVVGGSATKAVTWVGGSLKVSAETAGTCVSSGLMNTLLVAGKTYQVSGDCITYDSVGGLNSVYIGDGAQLVGTVTAVGKFSFTFTSAFASTKINMGRTSGGSSSLAYSQWDNISVKEVLSYGTDQNHIKYDAVDDKLITTLPAQLTGCTVIRSVPNVGTKILTGQTIPTPYNDNTDHCGLIVINRALTASETSQITKLFNKAAGV